MIKKISVDEVCVGMHIHAFCGSWVSHPFWRPKFTLTTPEEVSRIQTSGSREVWIDTDQGVDVGVAVVAPTAAATRSLPLAQIAPSAQHKKVAAAPRQTREQALSAAAALCRRAQPQVKALFAEARMGRVPKLADCSGLVDEISESVMRNPDALINVARLKRRDEYTYMHSVAVCALMVALGHRLKLATEDVKVAGLAGMMHDLGKAVMPLEILNKATRLTDDEFAVMRTHPNRGAELLRQGLADQMVLDVCLHHHEKVDGSGYPHQLQGEQISLMARMGAICDVYDAVTSERCYKRPWGPGDALRQMAKWNGHFDSKVFQAFVATVGIYPTGSLVRLASGRLAVVIAQNESGLLMPTVKVFFSTKSDMRIDPVVLDLAKVGSRESIIAAESPTDWSFGDLTTLWQGAGE